MPKAFLQCVKNGGRVVTVKPRPDVYIRVCYPKGGGKPIPGEIHHLTNTKGKSGLGVGGGRRFGRPKTEAERRATHKRLHGTTKLPPRGSGYLAKALGGRK